MRKRPGMERAGPPTACKIAPNTCRPRGSCMQGSGGPPVRQPSLRLDPKEVEALLEQLYLEGGSARDEDHKKSLEVAGLLGALDQAVPQPVPRGKPRLLIDAAAGHGY